MKIKSIEKKAVMRLASVIIGIVLWIIIVYTENASIDANLNGIPVKISGESVLMSNNLVLVNKDEIKDVSLSVRGKRNDVIKSMGNIYASADVSKIEAPGTYNIKITYELGTDALYITNAKTYDVELKVEEIVAKELDVKVIHEGELPDSEKVVESIADKKKINVKGSGVDMDRVAYAAVYVDVSEIYRDNESEYRVVLMDGEDKQAELKNRVQMEAETLKVTNLLHKKAELKVKVVFPEEYEKKYAFDIEWQSVETVIAGMDENIEISEIKAEVKNEDFDIDAGEYVAEWVKEDGVYIDSEETINIKAKATKIVEKDITVPLNVEKEDDGKEYNVQNEITLRVRGGESHISEENITAKVNVKDLPAGNNSVKVEVEFSKERLKLMKDAYVTVFVQ